MFTLSKTSDSQNEYAAQAMMRTGVSGRQLAGSWLEFDEYNPSSSPRIRSLTGGSGSMAQKVGEGAGVLALQTGASAGSTGFEFGGNGGTAATIRNVRDPWYSVLLARSPAAFNANTRLFFGVMNNTTEFLLCGAALFGSTSQTQWQAARIDTNTSAIATFVTPSTKTVANTTGAAGNYKAFESWCDGTNVYVRIDGENPILLGAAASLWSALGGNFRVYMQPAAGTTDDGFYIDAFGLWSKR